MTGFGARVTANGARSFVVNYRTKAGRERRYTIGQFPAWKVSAARAEAAELRKWVDRGEDPMGEFEALRAAPTMADLCQRFEEEHLPRLRPRSQLDYKALIARHILPALRNHKVADVTFTDIDALHRRLNYTPYVANRVISILSKMFALAIKWGLRTDVPTRGIERNPEPPRHRYLTVDELRRLSIALTEHDDPQAANIIRLLLLTGARLGEVRAMRWEQLDLEIGVWSKPSGMTKQKRQHRVPLSAPARQLLGDLRAAAPEGPPFVFPARSATGYRASPDKNWKALLAAAGIVDARLHDLRHTYASVLVSSGLSLPVIGALLGHSQPATTHRYAHLFDDPLRAATETAGAIISGKPSAEVVKIRRAE